jgi:diaminohydroxyphosphoribosylaminopyrimidine deaminase/5-amino-6-(5-phosphoribosylamino)uracil reductase
MTPDLVQDEIYMARALELARATRGLTSPNPQVGCVLVNPAGEVIGEGAHVYDRFDHAEIVALKQAAAEDHATLGATAYVTLEPCSHHGRTGPCADALIAAGIARCVLATSDPNPQVGGRGIARLQAAGIAITVGILQEPARTLNDAFAFSVTRQRPFVTLKAGLSVDGQLAPHASLRSATAPFFLTGPESRADVQRLRHGSDAILTGIGTVLADSPLLTDRTGLPRRRPLMRVVLDSALRIPLEANLLHPIRDDLWIFCSQFAASPAEEALLQAGARVTRVPESSPGRLLLLPILTHLHEAEILSLLLETGSLLNGAFLQANLVDRVILYYAEAELGLTAIPFAANSVSPFALEQTFLACSKDSVGADIRVSGLLHDPWAV